MFRGMLLGCHTAWVKSYMYTVALQLQQLTGYPPSSIQRNIRSPVSSQVHTVMDNSWFQVPEGHRPEGAACLLLKSYQQVYKPAEERLRDHAGECPGEE